MGATVQGRLRPTSLWPNILSPTLKGEVVAGNGRVHLSKACLISAGLISEYSTRMSDCDSLGRYTSVVSLTIGPEGVR